MKMIARGTPKNRPSQATPGITSAVPRNTRGTVAFAASGPNSRAAQLFFSTGDNARKLDGQRMFAPIGRIVEGMDVVERLNAEYGEAPNHSRIVREGNRYLEKWYPALDSIVAATIVP